MEFGNLAYVVTIDELRPIEGYDRVEHARIGGWWVIVRKDQFKVGDPAIYFEIDSRVPATEPFAFMEKRGYKVKTLKMCKVLSQGLLMSAEDFGWKAYQAGETGYNEPTCIMDDHNTCHYVNTESRFLTKELGVVYADAEDNKRKAASVDKYKKMAARHPKIFKQTWARWLMRREWGKRLLFVFFGKKRDKKGGWPVGKFPGVSKTDQERCENMPYVLEDKEPYIRTQKCDGSSGTFILERKSFNRFEFYVCSRNVRMMEPDQKCFYDNNYYWEAAIKYDIQNKMKDYLMKNKDISFVCWQGEICAPGIQKNPHHLKELHLYLFHMTDSKVGRYDIRDAAKIWKEYNMEVVPIDEALYTMPDDFEEFKKTADGMYDASCCEGHTDCAREGYVYYKVGNPTYSFKNVSREYLLNL